MLMLVSRPVSYRMQKESDESIFYFGYMCEVLAVANHRLDFRILLKWDKHIVANLRGGKYKSWGGGGQCNPI